MDNTHIYIQQIQGMNYFELVQMLMKQIIPEIRKCILERLTEMNNDLITANKIATMKAQQMHMYTQKNQEINIPYTATSAQNSAHNSETRISNFSDDEIDIDDIIDDVQKKPDELDLKLGRIKNLYDKIVADKRRRRNTKKKEN